MRIARQTIYAIRVMIYLAGQPLGEREHTETIAEVASVPRAFLSKVISKLVVAGLVITRRGMGGGVSLARSPEEITLLRVVEAMEGPVFLYRCLRHPAKCQSEPYCAACDAWRDIQAHFVQALDAVTMKELSSRHKEKEGNNVQR